MADILSIAISGLRASQSALAITGHNITNAGTEGYSRQVVNQSANAPQNFGGVWMGSGVRHRQRYPGVRPVFNPAAVARYSIYNSFDTLATNARTDRQPAGRFRHRRTTRPGTDVRGAAIGGG